MNSRWVTPSEMAAHRACRHKWAYAWALELQPPDKPGGAAAVGTAVHACIAAFLSGEASDPLEPLRDAQGARGVREDDERIAAYVRTWAAHAAADSEIYRQAQGVAVEKRVRWPCCPESPAGSPETVLGVEGTADAIVRLPRSLAIVDHKTTWMPAQQWQRRWGLSTEMQLRLYDLCVCANTGDSDSPVKLAADVIGTTGVTRLSWVADARSRRATATVASVQLMLIQADLDDLLGDRIDLNGNLASAMMSPSAACEWCSYRNVCALRMRGAGRPHDEAAAALARVPRLAYREKAGI